MIALKKSNRVYPTDMPDAQWLRYRETSRLPVLRSVDATARRKNHASCIRCVGPTRARSRAKPGRQPDSRAR